MEPAGLPVFDPSAGRIIREPPGSGYGFWVGGPKVWHDPASGVFALFYRERTPLERGRGARCAVALSDDGIGFADVWSAAKEELAATSIEVGHCVRHDDDEWRLYVSYEYAATGRWRIDVIQASEPAGFEAQSRRTAVAAGDFGLGFVKDPWVVRQGDGYRLYAAGPPRHGPQASGPVIHAGPLDATLLAESDDGLYFPTLEYVFEPAGDDSWHGRRARLNSLFRWGTGLLATWDGGRTFYDNYEEWCGLASSPDGRSFTRIDTAGPWVRSPHGSVRYVYGLPVDDRIFFYYEYTRADLSHDLRVAVVDA